jgi:dATP pyrophosphohydrolase
LRKKFVRFKQPQSVQVVVFADEECGRRYLLLKRIESQGGFWQSVTGSLEDGETHRQAAVREVWEETGIRAREEEMIDLGLSNTFDIAPQWRVKYAPGVTQNTEVCFALRVRQCEIRIDSSEHDTSLWTAYESCIGMLYWESSKRAFVAAHLCSE